MSGTVFADFEAGIGFLFGVTKHPVLGIETQWILD